MRNFLGFRRGALKAEAIWEIDKSYGPKKHFLFDYITPYGRFNYRYITHRTSPKTAFPELKIAEVIFQTLISERI